MSTSWGANTQALSGPYYPPSSLPEGWLTSSGEFTDDEMAQIFAALKAAGFTPSKNERGGRGFRRYWAKVLKRARSNHPHNAKYKPMHKVWVSIQVARKLRV